MWCAIYNLIQLVTACYDVAVGRSTSCACNRDQSNPSTRAASLSAPSPCDRIEDPFAPPEARTPRRVDWYAWQSRIRDVSATVRNPTRPGRRPPRLTRVGLGLLVGVALVVAAFGGMVFGGRPSEAVRAGPVAAALSSPGGTSPEYQPVEDPAPPPPPETESGPAAEPAREPTPPPSGPFPVDQVVFDFSYDGRRLQTVVRVPTDRGSGPFPLVVFAHGYATQTSAYGRSAGTNRPTSASASGPASVCTAL